MEDIEFIPSYQAFPVSTGERTVEYVVERVVEKPINISMVPGYLFRFLLTQLVLTVILIILVLVK